MLRVVQAAVWHRLLYDRDCCMAQTAVWHTLLTVLYGVSVFQLRESPFHRALHALLFYSCRTRCFTAVGLFV